MNTPESATEKLWEVLPSLWYTIRSRIHAEVGQVGEITLTQFHVLRRIRKGENSVSSLAESGHISRPAVSRTVDLLVDKGFIHRQRDAADRRSVQLTLTDRGEEILGKVFGAASEWITGSVSELNAGEIGTIIDALALLQAKFLTGENAK